MASRFAKRRNALYGAEVTWCPECKRKAALSQNYGSVRICRYCKARVKDDPRSRVERVKMCRALVTAALETTAEPNPKI